MQPPPLSLEEARRLYSTRRPLTEGELDSRILADMTQTALVLNSIENAQLECPDLGVPPLTGMQCMRLLHEGMEGPPPTGMSVVTERQPLHLAMDFPPATGITSMADVHMRAMLERMPPLELQSCYVDYHDMPPLIDLDEPADGLHAALFAPPAVGMSFAVDAHAQLEQRIADARRRADAMTEDQWQEMAAADRAAVRSARYMHADSGGRDATSITVHTTDAPPPPGVPYARLGGADYDLD